MSMAASPRAGAGTSPAPRTLVLASDNPGKLAELQALLGPLAARVRPQGEMGIAPAAEPFGTFLENALAKARHAALASGLPALADDSGLCCRALGGAPGVRSSRFAGERATDADNNALLLLRLAGLGDRRAHYRCVIVALRSADDPEPLVAEGLWEGRIIDEALGSGGFGYDSHFWLPALACTAAQLDAARKNALSHRARAMQSMVALLQERWDW